MSRGLKRQQGHGEYMAGSSSASAPHLLRLRLAEVLEAHAVDDDLRLGRQVVLAVRVGAHLAPEQQAPRRLRTCRRACCSQVTTLRALVMTTLLCALPRGGCDLAVPSSVASCRVHMLHILCCASRSGSLIRCTGHGCNTM